MALSASGVGGMAQSLGGMAGFSPLGIGLSVGGGLLSMLGGGGGLSKDQQALLQQQKRIANQFERFGNGVPGSDPGERAAQAQNQALLGEQQLGQQNNAYAALNRNQGVGSLADFLQNMASSHTAQRMNLDSSHLMNALAQRRQMLLAAANVSQGAGSLASQQGQQNPLPALFGQLGQALAYKQYGPRGPQGGVGGQAGAGGAQQPATLANLGVSEDEFSNNAGKFNAGGQQGAAAPGNEMYGANTFANQFRQSLGLGGPGVPGWSGAGGALGNNPMGGSWLPPGMTQPQAPGQQSNGVSFGPSPVASGGWMGMPGYTRLPPQGNGVRFGG